MERSIASKGAAFDLAVVWWNLSTIYLFILAWVDSSHVRRFVFAFFIAYRQWIFVQNTTFGFLLFLLAFKYLACQHQIHQFCRNLLVVTWLLDPQADKTIVRPDSRECAGKFQDLLLGAFSLMLEIVRVAAIATLSNRHLTSRMFVFFPTLLGKEYLVEKWRCSVSTKTCMLMHGKWKRIGTR